MSSANILQSNGNPEVIFFDMQNCSQCTDLCMGVCLCVGVQLLTELSRNSISFYYFPPVYPVFLSKQIHKALEYEPICCSNWNASNLTDTSLHVLMQPPANLNLITFSIDSVYNYAGSKIRFAFCLNTQWVIRTLLLGDRQQKVCKNGEYIYIYIYICSWCCSCNY